MHYTGHDVYTHISQKKSSAKGKSLIEAIVQRKTCPVSGAEFPLYQSDLDFYRKISPMFSGTLFEIPTPTVCPEERQRRRMLWRNERALYKSTCSASGKGIISTYHPDTSYSVYAQDVRRGNSRDGKEYGKDIDFSKPFFEQFGTLHKEVPRLSLLNSRTENGKYSNYSGDNKDVYMVFASWDNESVLHAKRCYESTDCIDMLHCYTCTRCRECTNCKNCVGTQWCQHCIGCVDSAYCDHCIQCSNCMYCTNLTNKQYHIFNTPYSKEDYIRISKKLLNSRTQRQHYLQTWNKKKQHLPLQACISSGSENISGNMMVDCNNCQFGLTMKECDDCSRGTECTYSTSCHDFEYSIKQSSFLYEYIGATSCSSSARCAGSFYNAHIYYCDLCMHSERLFGCVGLKNSNTCILNKAYNTLEYETLVSKLISHMQETGERGEFFPASLSPYAYNESIAMEHFPLDKMSAKKRGRTRREREIHTSHIGAENSLPDSIRDVSDEIVHKTFICRETKRPFRISPQEFQFYKKHTIPLPLFHPDLRHMKRIKNYCKKDLYTRKCDKTSQVILSIYPPGHSQPVRRNDERKNEVYG